MKALIRVVLPHETEIEVDIPDSLSKEDAFHLLDQRKYLLRQSVKVAAEILEGRPEEEGDL